ncbi:hypothetical protein, partial [Mesomycoplasma ovipneumoniae]|uniref:hypothetical protein n=1 Tax=Mesomycoplasma ovipneumoniae TaxID=29562 RepID=UPI003080DBF3
FIPEDQNSSELIIELSGMAKNANLKTESLSFSSSKAASAASDDEADTKSPAKSNPTKDASEISFQMRVSGSFGDIMNFLKNTESNSRLITIKSIILGQNQDVMGLDFTGTAYWKKSTSQDHSLANITLSPTVIEKFQSLKTYSVINLPQEEGYGRANPFGTLN